MYDKVDDDLLRSMDAIGLPLKIQAGITGWSDRSIEARRRRLGISRRIPRKAKTMPRRRPTAADRQRIASLAAGGYSGREIAARLSLPEHKVYTSREWRERDV